MASLEESVEKTVEKILAKQRGGEVPDGEDKRGRGVPPAVIKRMFSAFPGAEGYYAKIYKVRASDGKNEYKDYIIENPEVVDDLEQEIVRIVNEKGWGHGTYRVYVHQKDKRGIMFTQPITIAAPTQTEIAQKKMDNGIGLAIPASAISGSMPQMNPIDEAIKIQERIDRSVEASRPQQQDVSAIARVVSDTLKAGMDMAKSMAPPPQPQNQASSVDIMGLISQAIAFLKESGILKPQMNEVDVADRVVSRLKEQGIIGTAPAKDDIMSVFERFRSIGVKFPWEEVKKDPFEDFTKMAEAIKNVSEMVNPPASAPSVSPGSGWKDVALQAILNFGGPLVETLKNWAETNRMVTEYKLRMMMQQGGMGGFPMNPVAPGRPNVPVSPQNAGGAGQTGQASQPSSFIPEMIAAISKQDEGYFDQIRQIIYVEMGSNILDGLMSGDISADFFIGKVLVPRFGPTFNNPVVKTYIDKFIAWLQKSGGEEDEVTVKCDTCQEEFGFSEEEWEKDDKKCDCGKGKLQRVAINPPSAEA